MKFSQTLAVLTLFSAWGVWGANNQDPSHTTTQPRTGTGTSAQAVKSDTEITRQIRQEIMKNETLSTAAKNVTIATTAGKVVLSGEVKNRQEKTAVFEAATKVAGHENVENNLVIRR